MKTERFPPTHEIDIQGQLKKCPHDIQRYVKMLEANLNKAEDNCRKVVHKALEEAEKEIDIDDGATHHSEIFLSLKEKY